MSDVRESAKGGDLKDPRRLAQSLRQSRDAIIEEWCRRVRDDPAIPSAEGLSTPKLKDHIPEYLDGLAALLESEGTKVGVEAFVAKTHAKVRSIEGYHLPEALRELSHLRAVVVDLCLNELPDAPTMLHSAIDRAMIAVATELARGSVETERTLRQTNEQFRLLVESVKDYAIFKVDLKGVITTWNPGVQRLLGYSQDEFIGQNFAIIFTPEERAAGVPEDEIRRAATGERVSDNGWHLRKDGSRFFAEGSVASVVDDKGRVHAFAKIMHDATQRRIYEEQLATNEERLLEALNSAHQACATLEEQAAMLDISTDAIFVREGSTIVSWNQGADGLYGYTKDEAIGRISHELLQTKFPEPIAAVEETLARSGLWSGELRHFTKAGHEICVMSRWVLRKDESSARVLESNTDITERKRVEEELRQAKEAAETASRAKSQFLANMSHEIRTPLGSILSFSKLLKEDELPSDERGDYLDIINRNGHALSALIDDILDLSKVEAGHLDIEAAEVSLPAFVHEILSLLGVKAREKGLTLEVVVRTPVPATIRTDAARLRQILVNIVGNAIKFTNHGGVTLRLQLVKDDDGHPLLELAVSDSGKGIAPRERVRLFQAFSQADSSTTREYGGTGLGLVLSRRLARALGGDLVLAGSEPGVGSIFAATIDPGPLAGVPLIEQLPTVNSVPSRPENIDRQALKGVRVLLAEDAPDNQFLIRRLLTQRGAKVDVVGNGADAVATAMAGDHDVVLMDLQMPQLDGYGATAELRRRGYSRPIIALTAHAMRQEREHCLSVGCDDHLTKPLSHGRLIRTVAAYAGREPVAH